MGALPVGLPLLSVGTSNNALKASRSAQPLILSSIVLLAVLTPVLYVLMSDGIAVDMAAKSLSDFNILGEQLGFK